MSQTQIRFCTSADGARLAYAVHGSGIPLVRVATWLTHLESDWDSPVWQHWVRRLGETHTVLRYDERGCGLSDPGVGTLSVDTWVSDLEAVVDAAGVERFDLLGVSQGAAIAVAYAARHPERVSRMVLYGGYARGRRLRGQQDQEDALVAAIRAGWTTRDPAFRHVFSMLFLPDGSPEQMAWYDELLRATTSVDSAVALFRARGAVDAADSASAITAPTLVIHARGDRVVPLEEGRLVGWSYGGFIVTDYVRAYGDSALGGIALAGGAVQLKPPTFDHLGPGLLANAQDMCSPELGANIAATRRFLRACSARPLDTET